MNKLFKLLFIIVIAIVVFYFAFVFGYSIENLVCLILNIDTQFLSFFKEKSISELQVYYPNWPSIVYLLLKLTKLNYLLSILIIISVAIIFYKNLNHLKLYIFPITTAAISLVILDFTLSFVSLNFRELFSITDENFINNQFYCVDDIGINIFCLDAIVPDHSGYGLNEQGFRSKYDFTAENFKSIKDTSQLIMFVGDSHTEGCCATPITNSFVDLINKKRNITTANFGVGGMDLLQYRLILEKHLSLVKPDLVIIPLSMSNDFGLLTRTTNNQKPLYYQTTYGYINQTLPFSHPEYEFDTYFRNWQEAKEYYLSIYKSNDLKEDGLFNLINKSNILRVIREFKNLKILILELKGYAKYYHKSKQLSVYDYQIQMNKIDSICKTQKINFLYVGVPSVNELSKSIINPEKIALEYGVYYSDEYEDSDFISFEDNHLNNVGHSKFASYIWPLIDSSLNYQTLEKVDSLN